MAETGLSSKQAAQLLQQYGANEAVEPERQTLLLLFFQAVRSPLIILLLITSSISAYFGDIRSFVTIMSMVVLSMFLDLRNTYRSNKAAEDLKKKIQLKAAVVRDGHEQELPASKIVPGDIVVLRVGDIIPADGEVLESKHGYVNESALTGESFPVDKPVGAQIWTGSSVTTGELIIKVTKTGKQTKFNAIVADLGKLDQPTEFDRELQGFSVLIIKVTVVLVVFVFLVNALLKGNYLESLMFAVALAVGMTPEMMPMIITLNLTNGSLEMAKRGVIVKRLSSIQNFGSMDILCTDKTGTLTEDRIVLVQHVDYLGKESEETFRLAYLNSVFTDGFKNPLDAAIQKHDHIKKADYQKLDEVPFDFARRRESVVVSSAKYGQELIVKGAPEDVFKVCSTLSVGSKTEKLTAAHMVQVKKTYEHLSTEGFRVLGIAKKRVGSQKTFDTGDEKDLELIGLLAFLDPPKKTVANTLKKMSDYGIAIKIITGDNELVSQQIASQINLKITGLLLGSEIDKLTDEQLNARAHGVNLFARVNPSQKLRIIQTIQSHGHVVGYIGDGINDAPSLKAADVGISVNNATDIAKESADMIMMKKDLDDLIEAIIEGRKTFVNATKYLMMALSSNFGNMFSMAGASVFLPFLPMLPVQVLLNNLVYDISQFPMPTDNVDPQDLKYPKQLKLDVVKRFMLVIGPISSVFDFVTFGILLLVLHLGVSQFQTGWFIESGVTQIFVLYIIRTKLRPFLDSNPSKYLVASTLIMVVLSWFIALTALGRYFGFTSLSLTAILVIIAIDLVYLAIVEVVKRWFYRRMVSQLEYRSM